MRKLFTLSACFGIICATALSASAVFIDPFTQGIDSTYWTVGYEAPASNPPTTVAGVNNRVEVTLGGLSGGSLPTTGGGLLFSQVVSGNFRASVDYALLNWDPSLFGGLRVGIGASDIGVVERTGNTFWGGDGNFYLTNFSPTGGVMGAGLTPTAATTGSLMLERVDDTVSGYYKDSSTNGEWTFLAKTSGYTDPVVLSFNFWSHWNDAVIGSQVAFDNSICYPPQTPSLSPPRCSCWGVDYWDCSATAGGG